LVLQRVTRGTPHAHSSYSCTSRSTIRETYGWLHQNLHSSWRSRSSIGAKRASEPAQSALRFRIPARLSQPVDRPLTHPAHPSCIGDPVDVSSQLCISPSHQYCHAQQPSPTPSLGKRPKSAEPRSRRAMHSQSCARAPPSPTAHNTQHQTHQPTAMQLYPVREDHLSAPPALWATSAL